MLKYNCQREKGKTMKNLNQLKHRRDVAYREYMDVFVRTSSTRAAEPAKQAYDKANRDYMDALMREYKRGAV